MKYLAFMPKEAYKIIFIVALFLQNIGGKNIHSRRVIKLQCTYIGKFSTAIILCVEMGLHVCTHMEVFPL